MRILAVCTSAECMSIGYFDGTYHTQKFQPEIKSHNRSLLSKLDDFLQENGLDIIKDIDYYAVVVGPGSFTGIRIGVATMNAFAAVAQKPVIEVTSLETLSDGTNKMVLLDCKHNNYYVGIFTGNDVRYEFMNKEETEKCSLPKEYLTDIDPERILRVAIDKARRGDLKSRATAFYIKSSSAEIEKCQ